MTAEPVLSVRGLVAGYDPDVPIVRNATLGVQAREIVALLGPNGAGKSTLVKAIAGLVPVRAGSVRVGGTDVTGTATHLLARAGLGFVPQTENVFATLSVRDNLALAAAPLPRSRRRDATEAMLAMFPDLVRGAGLLGGALSGGQRQMLALARALIGSPSVLLLDEPTAGLSPKLATQVLRSLTGIRDSGVAVLLVEQNARAALRIADRGIVMVEGRPAYTASAPAMLEEPELGARYLMSASA